MGIGWVPTTLPERDDPASTPPRSARVGSRPPHSPPVRTLGVPGGFGRLRTSLLVSVRGANVLPGPLPDPGTVLETRSGWSFLGRIDHKLCQPKIWRFAHPTGTQPGVSGETLQRSTRLACHHTRTPTTTSVEECGTYDRVSCPDSPTVPRRSTARGGEGAGAVEAEGKRFHRCPGTFTLSGHPEPQTNEFGTPVKILHYYIFIHKKRLKFLGLYTINPPHSSILRRGMEGGVPQGSSARFKSFLIQCGSDESPLNSTPPLT